MTSAMNAVKIPSAARLRSTTNVDERRASAMRADFVLIFQELCKLIVDRARDAIAANHSSFRLFNVCEDLVLPLKRHTNIKPYTFFTGFWSTETHAHNTQPFIDAGIDTMMLEALQRAFSARQYHIQDVSNPNISFAHVLQIDIDDCRDGATA